MHPSDPAVRPGLLRRLPLSDLLAQPLLVALAGRPHPVSHIDPKCLFAEWCIVCNCEIPAERIRALGNRNAFILSCVVKQPALGYPSPDPRLYDCRTPAQIEERNRD